MDSSCLLNSCEPQIGHLCDGRPHGLGFVFSCFGEPFAFISPYYPQIVSVVTSLLFKLTSIFSVLKLRCEAEVSKYSAKTQVFYSSGYFSHCGRCNKNTEFNSQLNSHSTRPVFLQIVYRSGEYTHCEEFASC